VDLAQTHAQVDQLRDIAFIHVAVVRNGPLGLDHVLGDLAANALQLDARPRLAEVEFRLFARRPRFLAIAGGTKIARQILDQDSSVGAAAPDVARVEAKLASHQTHGWRRPHASYMTRCRAG